MMFETLLEARMQQTTASTKEWVTIKNAAVITGYNPEYIRQLVRAGQIAARKEGVALKIDSDPPDVCFLPPSPYIF